VNKVKTSHGFVLGVIVGAGAYWLYSRQKG
jgi:hypothetical protein